MRVNGKHPVWSIDDVLDGLFVLITAIVAYHGLTFRDEAGALETGHLLFGAIALIFCLRVLLVDILHLI